VLSFAVGIATGCLIGVSGTLILLFITGAGSKQISCARWQVSAHGFAIALLPILLVAWAAYTVKLGITVPVLLLLLTVLVIAGTINLAASLFATLAAAVVLSFLLPPRETIAIARPRDRWILTLFLLIAVVGSRLIAAKTKNGRLSP
jgi:K+-sensing histidine kinase KdpD